MTNRSIEVEATLRLALEALQDYVDEYGPWSDDSGAQYVLRVGKEVLAQPEQKMTYQQAAQLINEMKSQPAVTEAHKQEPVAWMVTTEMQDGTKKTYPLTGRFKDVNDICDFGNPVPLYTTPPQPKEPEQEPVAFDRQVLDSWTKEYKAEADYWKARHDVLLQALKNISSDAKQKESVGVVTGCASHGDYFTVVLRSKIAIPDGASLYTTPYVATPRPQRTAEQSSRTLAWVGLTEKEIQQVAGTVDWTDEHIAWNFASGIEELLKEKNTRSGGCL